MPARGLLPLAAILLAGCMAPAPATGPVLASSTAAAPSVAKPQLWYVGLGLYDETWSEGDVVATAAALEGGAQGFTVVPVVLSNNSPQRYAPPTRRTIEATLADIAQRAGPDDVVLVYVSAHGAPGLLGREAGGREEAPVTVAEVRGWLAPLRDQTTVLVLSACFSGSFIPALAGEHRIVLAAARADRTSFGCRAGAEHTVFGAALLDALATPRESLRDVVSKVREAVTERERELRVDAPSEPQLFVGPAAGSLFDAPVF